MKKIIIPLILIFISFINAQENEIINFNGQKTTKPYIRFKHFEEFRNFPANQLNSSQRINAIKQTELLTSKVNKKILTQAQQPEWKCIGPFNVGGRVKSIALHPTDDNIAYIGAAAGGIWKTTDKGQSWTPIFDFENGIGFGSISIDLNNPNIIYAATGEAVLNSAAPMYLSSGVYKSTDAGNSWTLIGLTHCGAFSKFYVHPKNSNKLVGGVVGSNFGFYYSTDAGQTWNKSENLEKNVTDISLNPENENEYIVGVMGEGVYYTSNSGKSWENRSNGLPQSINRISVQMAPSNPEIVYCLFEEGEEAGIFKSTNKGLSWQRVYRGNSSFFNGQGWYNNYIAVNPTNPNIVIAGGIYLWMTSDGGKSYSSWKNITNGYQGGNVHVDQHCGAFSTINPNELWIGNDGGMYLSKNGGNSFLDINNGLAITQFYSFDVDQSVENKNYGGTQDNGTLGNNINPQNWEIINGGDGFQTVLDYETNNTLYGEVYTANTVFPFTKNLSNNSYKLLSKGLTSDVNGIWDPPLEMHPLYNFVLYHGRSALYYSFDYGTNWYISIPPQTYKFTAISASPLLEELIYAGTMGGDLFITENHFETYKNVANNGLVARPITDIECSSINPETAFVTVSGFGTAHIFKTTNKGENWINISDKFPDIPCNTIKLHPENEDWIFVGTDIGVFATFNGGQTWLPFGRKLPRTIVTDLEILDKSLKGNYVLRASTFGRSIWEIDLPNEIITDYEITSPTGGELLVGTAKYTFSWYGFDIPVKVELTHDNGENWITIADNLNSNYLLVSFPNKETHNNRIKVSSINKPEQVKISNPFTISAVKRGSVLEQSSFNYVPYGIALSPDGYLWATSFYNNNLYKIDPKSLRVIENIKIPGDSLFTDLTFDKPNNLLYVHRMNSSGNTGTGGKILQCNLDGTLIKEYESPAINYPIGLEMLDGKLLACDRDGYPKYMYLTEPGTSKILQKYENPFSEYLGPRSICYDGNQYLYQASTHFSTAEGIIATYIVKIDKNTFQEVDRILLTSRSGIINCRGIEYDKNDKNFWITDFGGNIYKIAGFETISSIEQPNTESNKHQQLNCEIYPNPANQYTNLFIYNTENINNITINIYNTAGVNVQNHKLTPENSNINHIILNTEKLQTGLYFIEIKSDKKTIDIIKMTIIK